MLLRATLSFLCCWTFLAGHVQSSVIATADHQAQHDLLKRAPNPSLHERKKDPIKSPNEGKFLSDYEQGVLRALAIQVRDAVETSDVIFLINNKASMLHPVFAGPMTGTKNPDLKVIDLPMSMIELFGTDEQNGKGKASDKGLDVYFDNTLVPALEDALKGTTRFQIVDYSADGKSRDGFRKAFEALVKRARDRKKDKLSEKAANALLAFPMAYINLVDWSRRPDGDKPLTMPKNKAYQSTQSITVKSKKNVISMIFGGKERAPVDCDFYPAIWKKGQWDCWKKHGDLDMAAEQFSRIHLWNVKNGGPVSAKNPPKDGKPDVKDKGANGFIYEVVKGAITRKKPKKED